VAERLSESEEAKREAKDESREVERSAEGEAQGGGGSENPLTHFRHRPEEKFLNSAG
jgi:hypothetical protein